MNLADYLAERGSSVFLARKLSAPQELVSQWKTGVRPVPIERCPEIERITDGAVTRMDLRPDDWHRIWPELAAAYPDRVPPDRRPEPASVGGR